MTQRVRGIYDFIAEDPAELGFTAGEIIKLVPLENGDPEWLYGRIGNREGAFPTSFVEPLDGKDHDDEGDGGFEDDEGLPDGWSSAFDKASGKTYYFNEAGKTTWTLPVQQDKKRQLGRTQRQQQQLGQTSRSAAAAATGKTDARGSTSKLIPQVTDELKYMDDDYDDDDDDEQQVAMGGGTKTARRVGGGAGGMTATQQRMAVKKQGTVTQKAGGARGMPGMGGDAYGGGDDEEEVEEEPDLKTARKQMAASVTARRGVPQPPPPSSSSTAVAPALLKKQQSTLRKEQQAGATYADDMYEEEEESVKRGRESIRTVKEARKTAEANATLRASKLPPTPVNRQGTTNNNHNSLRTSGRRRRSGPSEEEIERFRRDHAAKKIQRAYRDSPLATGGKKRRANKPMGRVAAKAQPPPRQQQQQPAGVRKRKPKAIGSRDGPTEEEIEKFRREHAAKKIQWAYRDSIIATSTTSHPTTIIKDKPLGGSLRQQQQQQPSAPKPAKRKPSRSDGPTEEEIERFRQEHAAKRIQRFYRAGTPPASKTRKVGGRALPFNRQGSQRQQQQLAVRRRSARDDEEEEEEGDVDEEQKEAAALTQRRRAQEQQRRQQQQQQQRQQQQRRARAPEDEDEEEEEDEQEDERRAKGSRMPPEQQLGYQQQYQHRQRQQPQPPPHKGPMVNAGLGSSTGGSGTRKRPAPLSLDNDLIRLISDMIEEKVAREFELRGLQGRRRIPTPDSPPESPPESITPPTQRQRQSTTPPSTQPRQASHSASLPCAYSDPLGPPVSIRKAPFTEMSSSQPVPHHHVKRTMSLDGSSMVGVDDLERRNREVRARVAARDQHPSLVRKASAMTTVQSSKDPMATIGSSTIGASGGGSVVGATTELKGGNRLYKECRSAVYAPTDLDPDTVNREAPDTHIVLDHIYGYNGDLLRYGNHERYSTNVVWLTTGEVVYPASTTVVIFDYSGNHQRFYDGHDDEVMSLCRHPSLDICASGQAGARHSKVHVFDASGSKVAGITTFLPSETARGVSCLDFSPDGELLVVVAEEDTYQKISVWDWQKSILLTQLNSKVARFHVLRFNPYCYVGLKKARLEVNVMYTLVSGASRQVKFWTLTMEKEKGANVTNNNNVVPRDKDGRAVFRRTRSERRWAYRLEGNGGTFRKGVEPQDALCVCFVREEEGEDAEEAVTPGRRKMKKKGARIYTLTGTDKGAIHVWVQLESKDGVDPDDALYGQQDEEDGVLKSWLAKGRLVSVVPDAHDGAVTSLCYTKELHMIVSCGKDGLINCWVPNKSSKDAARSPLQMVRSVQLLGSIPGVGVPRSIAWSQEKSCWAVGTTGCTICLLRPKSRRLITAPSTSEHDGGLQVMPIIRGHTGSVRALAEHPILPVFATAGADKTLRLWDSAAKKLVYINRLWDRGTALAFHPGGALLAVGTEEGEVIVLECLNYSKKKALQQLHTLERSDPSMPQPAIVRLDEWKVVARRGVLLATQEGNSLNGSKKHLTPQVNDFKGAKVDVCALRWSPDGRILAAACRDKLVHLFSREMQYRRLGSCRGHSTAVIRMDFSADGKMLQTNDMGREVLFWDVDTAKQVCSASSTRDVRWDSWTCIYGWPVQGIWTSGGTSENNKDTGVPVVTRSHDESVLAVGDHRRMRLLRYPCLKGAGFKTVPAHASTVTGVTFLKGDTTVVSTGGTDLCVFQWRHRGGADDDITTTISGSSSAAAAYAPSVSMSASTVSIGHTRMMSTESTSTAAFDRQLSVETGAYQRQPSKSGVLSPTAASAARLRMQQQQQQQQQLTTIKHA